MVKLVVFFVQLLYIIVAQSIVAATATHTPVDADVDERAIVKLIELARRARSAETPKPDKKTPDGTVIAQRQMALFAETQVMNGPTLSTALALLKNLNLEFHILEKSEISNPQHRTKVTVSQKPDLDALLYSEDECIAGINAFAYNTLLLWSRHEKSFYERHMLEVYSELPTSAPYQWKRDQLNTLVHNLDVCIEGTCAAYAAFYKHLHNQSNNPKMPYALLRSVAGIPFVQKTPKDQIIQTLTQPPYVHRAIFLHGNLLSPLYQSAIADYETYWHSCFCIARIISSLSQEEYFKIKSGELAPHLYCLPTSLEQVTTDDVFSGFSQAWTARKTSECSAPPKATHYHETRNSRALSKANFD